MTKSSYRRKSLFGFTVVLNGKQSIMTGGRGFNQWPLEWNAGPSRLFELQVPSREGKPEVVWGFKLSEPTSSGILQQDHTS